MAKSMMKYSVFLASPGDLQEEREEIESVITEFNLSYGSRNDVFIDLIKWETHSAPGVSDTYTQDLINKDIGNDYDIYIGLLWQRFGTKTKVADSGTEEEFINALNRFRNKENIQIMFYFKDTPPKSLDEIDLDQLQKVRSFRNKLKDDNVLYWGFNNIDELKTSLRLHIPKRIESLKSQEESFRKDVMHLPAVVSNVTDVEEIFLEDEYGIFDYIVLFESLMAQVAISLSNMTSSTAEMGEELDARTDEMNRAIKSKNVNKVHLLGILKRVSKVMNDYSKRIDIEAPIFHENFKEAIEVGIKYINFVTASGATEYNESLLSTLEASISLRDVLPTSIEGMKGMKKSIESLPRIQSDVNSAKRKLEKSLQELLDNLESSYKMTGEFVAELENKIDVIK